MELVANIKAIREQKGLKQIEVANHIGVDKSAYSKIEKGLRALTIEELCKMAQLFGMTTDQIIHYQGDLPQEVSVEDQPFNEQVRLIQQLDEEDRQTMFRLIDKMLTGKRFKEFFEQNMARL